MLVETDDDRAIIGASAICTTTAEAEAVITHAEPLTRRRKPTYLPSPAEIEAECRRIRSEWSRSERITRRMRGAPDLDTVRVTASTPQSEKSLQLETMALR